MNDNVKDEMLDKDLLENKSKLLNLLIDFINSSDHFNVSFKFDFITNKEYASIVNDEENVYSTRLPCHLTDEFFSTFIANSSAESPSHAQDFLIIRKLVDLYKRYFIDLKTDFKRHSDLRRNSKKNENSECSSSRRAEIFNNYARHMLDDLLNQVSQERSLVVVDRIETTVAENSGCVYYESPFDLVKTYESFAAHLSSDLFTELKQQQQLHQQSKDELVGSDLNDASGGVDLNEDHLISASLVQVNESDLDTSFRSSVHSSMSQLTQNNHHYQHQHQNYNHHKAQNYFHLSIENFIARRHSTDSNNKLTVSLNERLRKSSVSSTTASNNTNSRFYFNQSQRNHKNIVFRNAAPKINFLVSTDSLKSTNSSSSAITQQRHLSGPTITLSHDELSRSSMDDQFKQYNKVCLKSLISSSSTSTSATNRRRQTQPSHSSSKSTAATTLSNSCSSSCSSIETCSMLLSQQQQHQSSLASLSSPSLIQHLSITLKDSCFINKFINLVFVDAFLNVKRISNYIEASYSQKLNENVFQEAFSHIQTINYFNKNLKHIYFNCKCFQTNTSEEKPLTENLNCLFSICGLLVALNECNFKNQVTFTF